MKALILYHPSSEFARMIEEYVHDFERTSSDKIDLISLETREGAAMASMYDVMQYPALLVTEVDGKLAKIWQGDKLPLMNELAGYLRA